jgi:diguanylate cyclase (GGDEF)-like protein/PAS domain S-box-containing protein
LLGTSGEVVYVGGSATEAAALAAILPRRFPEGIPWHPGPVAALGPEVRVALASPELRYPAEDAVLPVIVAIAPPRDETDLRVLDERIRAAEAEAQLLLQLQAIGADLGQTRTDLETLLDRLADGVVVVDEQGEIRRVNPAGAEVFGRRVADLVGRPFGYPLIEGGWVELEILRADRLVTIAEMRAVRSMWQGQPAAFVSLRDITGRKRAEQALRDSEERYALAAHGANDGLWDWHLDSGHVFYSARWREMLGLVGHEIAPAPESWFDRVHANDRDTLQMAIDEHLSGATDHLEHEHRVRAGDGSSRWVVARAVLAHDIEGNPYRLTGSLTDVTARVDAERELLRQALHDPLTGLPNRALFTERLEAALAQLRRRSGYRCGVIFLDLDGFKLINDTLGHAAGDAVIVEVGGRLETAIRPGDTVARLGGDEFGLLVEGIQDVSDLRNVAVRLLRAIDEPIDVGGRTATVGASIGLVGVDHPVTGHDVLLSAADRAMYEAKRLGRNRYVLSASLEGEDAIPGLRDALDDGRLDVVPQAVIDLHDGALAAIELLPSLRTDDGTVRTGGALRAAAEEVGLGWELARLVLTRTSEQIARWRSAAPVEVHVPVSPSELDSGIFAGLDLTLATSMVLVLDGASHHERRLDAAALTSLRERGFRLGLGPMNPAVVDVTLLSGGHIDLLRVAGYRDADRRQEAAAIIRLAERLGVRTVALDLRTAGEIDNARLDGADMASGSAVTLPLPSAETSSTPAMRR